MSIRIFNVEFDQFGSGLCAVTSIALVVAGLWAILKIGELIVSGIMSTF